MEEMKRQLYRLQSNIDIHIGNNQLGNPCPTCGIDFMELAENLDAIVQYEIRKRFTLDPDIVEGEIVERND